MTRLRVRSAFWTKDESDRAARQEGKIKAPEEICGCGEDG